jgi:hypothetical protein
MPLVAAVLEAEMLKLTDENDSGFVGFPATTEDAAVNWANALSIYLIAMTNPPVAAAAVPAARATAEQAYIDAVNDGDNPLDAVLVAYVDAISTAAKAVPTAVVVDPIGDPPIAIALAPFIVAPTSDPGPPAQQTALGVQAWLITGQFGLPPPGAPPPGTPWS